MVAFFSSIKLTVKNSIFFFGENKFRKKGENCMKKILSLILFVLIVSSVYVSHPTSSNDNLELSNSEINTKKMILLK